MDEIPNNGLLGRGGLLGGGRRYRGLLSLLNVLLIFLPRSMRRSVRGASREVQRNGRRARRLRRAWKDLSR